MVYNIAIWTFKSPTRSFFRIDAVVPKSFMVPLATSSIFPCNTCCSLGTHTYKHYIHTWTRGRTDWSNRKLHSHQNTNRLRNLSKTVDQNKLQTNQNQNSNAACFFEVALSPYPAKSISMCSLYQMLREGIAISCGFYHSTCCEIQTGCLGHVWL